MRNKLFSLLVLIPVLIISIFFVAVSHISLPIESKADRIVLQHENYEAVEIDEDKPYELYAYAIPESAQNSEIKWSLSDDTMGYIENNKLYGLKEGEVTVYASTIDESLVSSFKVYLYFDDGSQNVKKVIVYDKTYQNSLGGFKYGQYDLDGNGKKTKATCELEVIVIPRTIDQNVDITTVKGDCDIFYSNEKATVKINSGDDISLLFSSAVDHSVTSVYDFDVVSDGVNIYTYNDLLKCTNRSKKGEVVVLRSSFDSPENSYYPHSESLFPNTQVFGNLNANGKWTAEYTTTESSYDLSYLKNIETETGKKQNTSLLVGLNVQKDFYGNGFTVNMHSLTYPSGRQSGTAKPYPQNDDKFRGPLPFVTVGYESLNVTVYGQDNIGMLVKGDNIRVENLVLRSCSNVSDLTHLDYVGTTMEIDGDNVTIADSVISNGRTVLRSFSNKNTVIENCLLSDAREFILKLGSNSFAKPPAGVDLSTVTDKEEFLSPQPDDMNGENSSMTVDDCLFYQSGFFSIGLDAHFCGEVLYGSTKYSLPGCYNLAGTSSASRLIIKGDTRFYDWKDVNSLDSSSIIVPSEGAKDLLDEMFNVPELVLQAIAKEYQESGIDLGYRHDNKTYVHGGIAYFGGGKNYSTVSYADDYPFKMETLKDILVTGLPAAASGPNPFKFEIYGGAEHQFFGEVPTLRILENHKSLN